MAIYEGILANLLYDVAKSANSILSNGKILEIIIKKSAKKAGIKNR